MVYDSCSPIRTVQQSILSIIVLDCYRLFSISLRLVNRRVSEQWDYGFFFTFIMYRVSIIVPIANNCFFFFDTI